MRLHIYSKNLVAGAKGNFVLSHFPFGDLSINNLFLYVMKCLFILKYCEA